MQNGADAIGFGSYIPEGAVSVSQHRPFRHAFEGHRPYVGTSCEGRVAAKQSSHAIHIAIANLDSMAGLLGRDSTLTGRTNIWAMALENIAERPVLGYGYNAFWNVAPGAERINTILHWKVPHAHNGFIDLTLQLGIVGLVLYIGIYFVAIRRALNLANETQEQEAIWPLTFVTFTLLYQVTESTILAGNTIIWMVFVSAICSVTQASEFETADSTAPVLQNIGAFAADEELA